MRPWRLAIAQLLNAKHIGLLTWESLSSFIRTDQLTNPLRLRSLPCALEVFSDFTVKMNPWFIFIRSGAAGEN